MRLVLVGLLILTGCGGRTAPAGPEPSPAVIVATQPVPRLAPGPSDLDPSDLEACLKALDLVERASARVARKVPASGGMTSEEVNRLALELREFEKEYRQLAYECRG